MKFPFVFKKSSVSNSCQGLDDVVGISGDDVQIPASPAFFFSESRQSCQSRLANHSKMVGSVGTDGN